MISRPMKKRLVLASFHCTQEEAALSLADLANDAIRSCRIDGEGGLLAVEVRDDNGPVLLALYGAFEFLNRPDPPSVCVNANRQGCCTSTFLSTRNTGSYFPQLKKCGDTGKVMALLNETSSPSLPTR